jgi:hypothetical protein
MRTCTATRDEGSSFSCGMSAICTVIQQHPTAAARWVWLEAPSCVFFCMSPA